MTQEDDEQANDVVKEAELQEDRMAEADAEREAKEADQVVQDEEREEQAEEDAEEDAGAEDARREDATNTSDKEELHSENPNCLPYLFYDKPIKTGSTAVTYALREYIMARGGRHRRCSYDACTPRALAVCNGTAEPEHLIGHIRGKEGQVECMKSHGYYAITSVRDPLERWTSAYLFNKMMKGSHYGIPYQESFATFMERYPDCTLYHYYDQLGAKCQHGKIGWRERLKNIVERYDEVIDLYDEDTSNGGVLFNKIKKYLSQENVSKKPKSDSYVEEFDKSRLEPEQALYDALQAKRREGSTDGSRVPC